MREQLLTTATLAQRLAEVEKTRLTHDTALRDLYHKLPCFSASALNIPLGSPGSSGRPRKYLHLSLALRPEKPTRIPERTLHPWSLLPERGRSLLVKTLLQAL